MQQRRQQKGGNSVALSEQKYVEIINKLAIAKAPGHKSTPADYWLRKRFDTLTVRGVTKLITPANEDGEISYFAKQDELFDIIHDAHIFLMHKSRDPMMKYIKQKYKNITQADVSLYLLFCRTCHEKKSSKRKGVVVKPLLFDELNSRCQVDLIDYQTFPSGPYKWIMVYQDHLTKFCFLKALQNKGSDGVAMHLIDIFSIVGAPAVLQSDNGREFVNQVINSLTKIWSDLKIVHGKPRHSQSQGSVERCNRDIENMVTAWMIDADNTEWHQGLPMVQFKKNMTYHSGKVLKIH